MPRPKDQGKPLTQQIGETFSGLVEKMDGSAQLNPALSRWLMGYPKEWCEAAILANRLRLTNQEKPYR